jgi:hypothetical protein
MVPMCNFYGEVTAIPSCRRYVRSKSGEVGTLITDLLHELNYIDVDELEQNAFVIPVAHSYYPNAGNGYQKTVCQV